MLKVGLRRPTPFDLWGGHIPLLLYCQLDSDKLGVENASNLNIEVCHSGVDFIGAI